MNPQLEAVAVEIYTSCDHTSQDGTTAFMPIGLYGEGFEQCVICGKVVCTEPLDDDDPPARYGL